MIPEAGRVIAAEVHASLTLAEKKGVRPPESRRMGQVPGRLGTGPFSPKRDQAVNVPCTGEGRLTSDSSTARPDLGQKSLAQSGSILTAMEWEPISTAPFDRDLALAVFDKSGAPHALVFPCRRILGGWVNTGTKERIEVHPTHWREWQDQARQTV
jgi:hypothetical protein